MKKMILASTSTIHGSGYLEYLNPTLEAHFKEVETVTFIPFARPGGISYDRYTELASIAFAKINKKVIGIHTAKNRKEALLNGEAIFIGGGNTFELLNQLYQQELLEDLKNVIENGIPYLGTSAGSNICGLNIKNTNDMPIIYPPSFDALGTIPFNINAHYLDPLQGSKHMGETRETRIKEFHVFNETPVLGLREGSWISVEGDEISLKGKDTARLFQKNKEAVEIASGSIL
ncbi:dipeptidase PepE [uncultured Polaribacter sp.]|uniref:dipeptidase PepE n=1 Tax=uncultured Polaribacter sp. TaxID=174711 RepID=UPI0032B2CB54|tara:strand:- start:61 stop:756 length:696 start_codon:yes stop_codon:yes gene_type:complete